MKYLGMVLWWGAGLVTWVIMILNLFSWWGVLGVIAGVIFFPGVIAFPFLYWLMESAFPIIYFIIWGVGIAGFIISSFFSE